MKQITVRVTTDAGALTARKYVDVANLSVQIFGEVDNQKSASTNNEPEPTGPFGDDPQTIPGKVETEHYDEGAPSITYKDNDAKNQGAAYRKNTQVDIEKRDDASNGHGIGWTKAGEWLNYTVDVAESGAYDIKIPVAEQKQGGLFHLEIGGKDLTGPIRIPDTGGWTQLKTVTHKGIKLKKGVHVLKFVMDKDGVSGYVGDIDCLVFARAE